jgi:mono/diheme cytochrome c family protein
MRSFTIPGPEHDPMRCTLPLIVLPTVLFLAACGGEPSNDQRGGSPPADDATPQTSPSAADEAAKVTADSSMNGAGNPASAGEIDAAALTLGRSAYTQGNCVMCHGADGGGARFGPDLTDAQWNHGDGGVASIRALLVAGIEKGDFVNRDYPMAMPPVTNLITDEATIDALATYVWSLSNQTGK